MVRDGMSLDHPCHETWKSSSNLVTLSVACSLSRTCISLFTDHDCVLHVKSQLNTYSAVLVTKTRNRCNTVFANIIETSNVKCTAKAIRWTQHKKERLAVFQYVDCHSADNVLKIDDFQLIICTVILKDFTY